MAIDNTVTLSGNVTREPELRFTPSGQAVASFGMAVNRRWQNRQTQEWEEAVSFFDITCWGALGENVAECVPKGARVMVCGRMDQKSWETQEGEKRSKHEVVADDVGVSLRWAQVSEIEKQDRRGDSSGGNSNTTNSNADEDPFA